MELRPYQQKGVNDIRASLSRHKRVLYVAPCGAGKCLGIDTPIIMYDGRIRKVQDIIVGDILIGPDSEPRYVKSTCSGEQMLYRIVPQKGDPYIVNEDHILSLRMGNKTNHSCSQTGIVNLSVKDYLSSNKTFKNFSKGWKTPLDFGQYEPLLINPYLLGLWLGDGSSGDSMITSGDKEIISWLYSYITENNLRIHQVKNSPNSWNLHIRELKRTGRGGTALLRAFRYYRLLHNKHIPHQYKTASRDDRLKLLAGIIDTDGSYSRASYDLTLKSERLIDDVIFIARSLGFSCYKKKCVKKCHNNGVEGVYFRININGNLDSIPCLLPRKKASARRQIKNHLNVGIRVEPIGIGKYYGFELSGPDGLFVLGDFTVTHNTQVFSYISKHASDKNNGSLILVHRRELIKQTSAALASWGVPHGIISPKYRQTYDDVQVASVQTLQRRLQRIPAPKLIIIDECHHSTAKMYRKVIDYFPDAKIIGFTASPARTDGQGLGQVYEDMVMGPSVQFLIDNGYLSKFVVYAPPQELDLSDVHTRGGDYAIEEIAEKMDKVKICGNAIQHYRLYLNGAPAIVFCVTVDHAKHVAEQFSAEGFKAEAVYGDMPIPQRDKIMSDLKEGRLNVVTSCALLDEGFDSPAVHGVILLRPTKSLILHIQQIGRAIRICEGKEQAIVLDHVNNCGKLGLPTQPIAWTLEGKNKPNIKSPSTCEKCYKVFYGRPSCDDAECPSKHATPTKKPPDEIDGELRIMDDPYAWAKGINIALAKGDEWQSLLHHAEGKIERLKQIQKLRGYKHQWIKHAMGDHSSGWWRKK